MMNKLINKSAHTTERKGFPLVEKYLNFTHRETENLLIKLCSHHRRCRRRLNILQVMMKRVVGGG